MDPVLESLIRGMLCKDPSERFSVADVQAHDWSRKKHPCNAPPVTVKPRNEDPALSTTVIPYLCDLHFGDVVDDDDEGEGQDDGGGGGGGQEPDLITEHELKSRQDTTYKDRVRFLADHDFPTPQSGGGSDGRGNRRRCVQRRLKEEDDQVHCSEEARLHRLLAHRVTQTVGREKLGKDPRRRGFGDIHENVNEAVCVEGRKPFPRRKRKTRTLRLEIGIDVERAYCY